MSCDFTAYNAARDETRNASTEAKAACDSEMTAQAALVDAQAALQAATSAKAGAYSAWQLAEQHENAEATKLGIDPIPVIPAI